MGISQDRHSCLLFAAQAWTDRDRWQPRWFAAGEGHICGTGEVNVVDAHAGATDHLQPPLGRRKHLLRVTCAQCVPANSLGSGSPLDTCAEARTRPPVVASHATPTPLDTLPCGSCGY